MVKAEAELLDLSIAGFCRWVILHSASVLKKHRASDSDSYEGEVESGEGIRIRRKTT